MLYHHLRRLASTGFAYTAASVIAKLIGIFLLPIYTAYLSPTDYGAAEVFVATIVAASIVIRFGLIEALLRFYYLGGEKPERVVATGFSAMFWLTTAGAGACLLFAEPISELLIDRSDPGLARLAILGIWELTLWEYMLTLLRVDQRPKAYFGLTTATVLFQIPLTVWLVVVQDMGPEGILLGTWAGLSPFLISRIWAERKRLALVPERRLLRRMLRFGLPTMPAELSLYSLNFIDRIMLVRLAGLAEAGLYALAVKFAQGMQVLARGFHLAWPPLAYSIKDDDEARRTYALIVSWFTAVFAFFVTGLWLVSRWIVSLLAAPEFIESYKAIGLIATGISLNALYLVLVVILGRTGRTEFSFPAVAAGTIANIGLNLLLIPEYGIVGAGLAFVGAYVFVIVPMYVITNRLFHVPYEWRRLGLAVTTAAALVVVGDFTMPAEGLLGLVGRVAVWFSFPLVLAATGFLTRAERRQIRSLLSPSAVAGRLKDLRSAPAPPDGGDEDEKDMHPRVTREVLEVEQMDEDSRS